MSKLDLIQAKSIKIEARNFHGDIKIQYAPVTHLEYPDSDVEVKTVWNSDNESVIVYINYEKGDFLSKFFSFSRTFHEMPVNLYINEEVSDLKLDLSAADLNIILNSTNVNVLSIKTSAGDLDIKGSPNSKYIEDFLIDTKAGDVKINLEGTIIDEFILKSAAGDFDILNIKVVNGEFNFASGDLLIENSEIDDLSIRMASGDISIKKSLITNARIKTASGDILVDSLSKDFYCEIDSASADIDLIVQGKDRIYLEGSIKRFSSSIKSNIDLIQKADSSLSSQRRILKANVMSGDITIQGISIEGEPEKESLIQEEMPIGDDLLTVEEKKILDLLKGEKISRLFALELLGELGYSREEAENFLKNRGL
ncbi:MAG: DUF4097 family beta strand repeat-containing protein [Defluviitoga sp.]|jgi:DUF4097 and DUF4098 domain-containing protein YvlB